jgi:hypothetical protein
VANALRALLLKLRYIAQQIDAHNEVLILMKGYAKDGDTPAIKTLAGKTAPSADASEHG